MYVHIASTYSIITLFAGDIWSNEIVVTVQALYAISVWCPWGDAWLLSQPFASHCCNIFNTDNGEREREREFIDGVMMRHDVLLIHISSTRAFHTAL